MNAERKPKCLTAAIPPNGLERASKAAVGKSKNYKICTIGVPTFGYVSIDWALAFHTMATPIFFSSRFVNVIGRRVDEARNLIVEQALKFNSSHILFIDDDVIPPRDGLIRLWNHNVPIVGGVYYSKVQPPQPLLFRFGELAGFEDWKHGDILKIDAIGMGFTLIQADIFRQMKPPWFKTIRDEKDGQPAIYTEDIYFCERVRKELNLDVLADTGVQCQHEDFDSKLRYFYEPSVGQAVWLNTETKKIGYLPKAKTHPEFVRDKTAKKKEKTA